MEGDPATSSGLEWQNLALYSHKPMQIPHQFGFPSSNELYPVSENPGRDFGVPDQIIGLRLGQQKEHGEAFSPASSRSLTISSSSSMPVSSTPAKRSRASYHNMQNPCCQVEGCNLDLKLAKDYHRRHRICESHSKSPKVIVAGMERRFCQQCSRFHDLSEFDDKKRSCRRRLSDHNARRRRVQPESIQLNSPGISPALYTGTDQRQQNVLLNGLPVSLPSLTWENANSSMARHSLMRPSKVRGLEGNLNDDVLHQCLHVASSNSSMAPDLMSAHSLLSSSSWSLNEGDQPSSMEGMVQGNYAPHSVPDSHHLTLFQTHNVDLDQGPPPPPPPSSSINMQNAASSHHQEYQLFKPPYHSGSFYSTQRSL